MPDQILCNREAHRQAGKSTLAALIARLWEAPPGTLLIDRRPIREWPLETLRRAVGYVPQDTFLFSETLRENVAFGVDSATDDEIHNAADVASIAAEIDEFPAKFNTMVGERGITLSGGQKAALLPSRAPGFAIPKSLILDDSLSSVDTGNRRAHPAAAWMRFYGSVITVLISIAVC